MSEQTPSPEDLTKLSMFFGRIPETHIKALERYPFIYFRDVTEAELDYNVETTNKLGTHFSYDLSLNLETNDHLKERFLGLESAIRDLFWKEAKVRIAINGEEVYKSE